MTGVQTCALPICVLLAPLLINSDLFAHTTSLELSDLDPTNEGRCMASLEQKKEVWEFTGRQ